LRKTNWALGFSTVHPCAERLLRLLLNGKITLNDLAPGIEIKYVHPLLPRYPHAYAGLTVSERGGGQAGCRAALFCRRHRPMP
jgi:hypothetical protein